MMTGFNTKYDKKSGENAKAGVFILFTTFLVDVPQQMMLHLLSRTPLRCICETACCAFTFYPSKKANIPDLLDS
ncbi:hypothetical protein [Vibrio parahaemolyticus]|uniref:hypothetical protein n=1 Tax=Vibrio parahaemolyticus TaxID=670 RepID=UPI002362CAF8|nr:hypothetical protein [Vibrio parahaemolyticus]